MNAPFFPDDAPFSVDQRAWIAGFMAGMRAQAQLTGGLEADGAQSAVELNILYGTQTGNAEAVALDAAEAAKAQGFAPRVEGLDDVSMEALAEMKQILIVISTYGEGEMPDNAELFWQALSATTAPRLEEMVYSVLALGDTSYDEFCHAGKLMDMRLEQLGAKRINARVDCDVDYEDLATGWIDATMPLVADVAKPTEGLAAPAESAAAKPKKSKYNRKNPYASEIVENRLLSGKGSGKEIRHFAFALDDEGLEYEAGDAMGVIPLNGKDYVQAIIDRLGAKWDAPIDGHDQPLGDVLTSNFEIMTPNKETIAKIAERADHDELSHVITNGDKEAIEAFMWGNDTLDLLNLNPSANFGVDEFISWLKPLQHRAYSISSSPKAHPGEVHLTVAAVRWQNAGREHRGVASTFLADQTEAGSKVGVFMSPNKSFRPPENDDAPMIMVGPGTGVAPFRAFLEEREARDAKGKNWLFFGDQTRAHDFIYQDEIGKFSKSGRLSRLDLAFSRDQKEKIYVQHRMLENGKDLYAWLEDGGYFYVCGDATRMAKDVDQALVDLIAEHGGRDADAARDYVDNLKREKRYLRDVY
ncbi:MAG: sulfite reductase subunit alpha [Pseudomonadota bacterium]